MTLTEAIDIIQHVHATWFSHKEIVMIEYEDGSGWNFNYRLKFDEQDRFINLKPYHEKLEAIKDKEELIRKLKQYTHTSFYTDISERGKEHTSECINQILNKI